jgi:hypothetical protein
MNSQSPEMIYVGLTIASLCLTGIVLALKSVLSAINDGHQKKSEALVRVDLINVPVNLVEFDRSESTRGLSRYA